MTTTSTPAAETAALRDEVARLTARLDREHTGLIHALCISRRLAHALGLVASHLEERAEDGSDATGAIQPAFAKTLREQIEGTSADLDEAFKSFAVEDQKRVLDGMVVRAMAHLHPNAA